MDGEGRGMGKADEQRGKAEGWMGKADGVERWMGKADRRTEADRWEMQMDGEGRI